MKHRVGLGYDIHPLAAPDEARPLVLGGVRIDGSAGLVGHSDADAIAHAVSDAILSAAGLEDLGTLFPATDDENAGADSVGLLKRCAQLVREAGWYIGNVDVVIAAEQPKLAPHIGEMKANVTAALSVAAAPLGEGVFVSIKPKRGEGIGAIGRVEGIAVWAVALLER